ncbi:MAG: Trm112 family protein [Candidatus Cloacimonetes bacterium]|nr:Trm112 family protein [Candidatus Cloacimonadota bacterium]
MSISQDLLNIICCPTTKQGLTLLSTESVEKLNSLQSEKKLKFKDGSEVSYSLSGALITEDQKTIYPIREDIPILLEEESINASSM